MQCCRTCRYIDSDFGHDPETDDYGKRLYFCSYPVKLPEIMKGTFFEDIIDDPDQDGGDCDCYELDKSCK